MPKKLLGLIAGNGKFPFLLARRTKAHHYRIVAAAISGDTSIFLRFFVDKLAWFNAGELEKLSSFLKQEDIAEVIMAGQVNPSHLFEKKFVLDREFQKLFDAMKNRKADTIFLALAEKLKEHGMELLDSTFLLKENLAPKGTITARGPTLKELEDIEFGKGIAKKMGDIDVGQTVVVKGKAILAIEAMEGTDRTIVRGSKVAREGAVVVKMSKPDQDLRFDVPVIGPHTIQTMKKYRASCLGVEAGKTLLIDKEICIKLANRAGICIVGA